MATATGEHMRVQNLLSEITAAAARCVPFAKIGADVGLTADEWRDLVQCNREAVAIAIAQGRSLAEIASAQALKRASMAGGVEATLYLLEKNHGWNLKPKRSRLLR
jgi:hypothetical protein